MGDERSDWGCTASLLGKWVGSYSFPRKREVWRWAKEEILEQNDSVSNCSFWSWRLGEEVLSYNRQFFLFYSCSLYHRSAHTCYPLADLCEMSNNLSEVSNLCLFPFWKEAFPRVRKSLDQETLSYLRKFDKYAKMYAKVSFLLPFFHGYKIC